MSTRRWPDAAAPDRQLALERYREHAQGYDASARRSLPQRRRTIARLALAPGETVLDAACGTGLSLPLLAAAVGPRGRVIGVELSPEMSALANVTLVQAPMEDAELDCPLDAVLFHYTHDVLRSPAALARIFAATRPGAHVAVAGMKLPPCWLAPLRPLVRARARPYMTTFEGLARPWNCLEPYLASFTW